MAKLLDPQFGIVPRPHLSSSEGTWRCRSLRQPQHAPLETIRKKGHAGGFPSAEPHWDPKCGPRMSRRRRTPNGVSSFNIWGPHLGSGSRRRLTFTMPRAPRGSDGFRLRSKLFQLTYKHHRSHVEILDKVRSKMGAPLLWSIVHEMGDLQCPYPHTHAAFLFAKAPDLSGADLFDLPPLSEDALALQAAEQSAWLEQHADDNDGEDEEGESTTVENLHEGRADREYDPDAVEGHPHFNFQKSMKWLETVYENYHRGWKTDMSKRPQKKIFKRPVKLWQEAPQGWNWTRHINSEIATAPTFQEAVAVSGLAARSLTDLCVLRRECALDLRSAPTQPQFDGASFAPHALGEMPPWQGRPPAVRVPGVRLPGALHMWGATGLGKSEFALTLVKNPLLVSELQGLKAFNPSKHEAIIFDDMARRPFARGHPQHRRV